LWEFHNRRSDPGADWAPRIQINNLGSKARQLTSVYRTNPAFEKRQLKIPPVTAKKNFYLPHFHQTVVELDGFPKHPRLYFNRASEPGVLQIIR
jgi:hypothetical protein